MTQTVYGLPTLSDPSLIRTQAFLSGVWVDAGSGFDVVNPANSIRLARMPKQIAADAKRAIDAARRTFASWSAQSGEDRAVILRRRCDRIIEHVGDMLAKGATLETDGSAHALGGLGRECSKYGIDDFPELTCLCVGGI